MFSSELISKPIQSLYELYNGLVFLLAFGMGVNIVVGYIMVTQLFIMVFFGGYIMIKRLIHQVRKKMKNTQ